MPTGLAGALVFVILFEVFVARLDRYGNDQRACWGFKKNAATREALTADVLCFGDSMVEFGVRPNVLAEGTGLRVYNLALHAGPPAAHYFLLRSAIRSGARPRAVIVDLMPHQLANGPISHETRHAWPELAGFRETIDLAWQCGDPGFVISTSLARVVPTYKGRHEIRHAVLEALASREYSAKTILRRLRNEWQQHRGAAILFNQRDRTADRHVNEPPLFPDHPTYDPVTLSYVRRFLALARAQGIAVFVLIPPIDPEAQERLELRGQASRYRAFLAQLAAEFPGLSIIDGSRSKYHEGLFADVVHLHDRGARVLSSDLAGILSSALAGRIERGEWLALSNAQEPPVAAPSLTEQPIKAVADRPGAVIRR